MLTTILAKVAVKQVKKRYGSSDEKMANSKSVGLTGAGYVVLNALRVFNIISLLMVVAACIVMLAKTQTSSHFFFFDAVSHVITFSICAFLIVSEIGIFQGYFAAHWPSFSLNHGFVTLGLAMIAIGTEVLGNLNKPQNSQAVLGMPFWRIVISSGILIMIFGVFNIFFNYIFRDRVSGVTARQIRAHGKIAITEARAMASMRAQEKLRPFDASSAPSSAAGTTRLPPMTPENKPGEKSPKRWTHRFNKPILPTYNAATSPVASSRYSPRSNAPEISRPMDISGPLNMNPQFSNLPGLVRPDSTYHPAMQPYPGKY